MTKDGTVTLKSNLKTFHTPTSNGAGILPAIACGAALGALFSSLFSPSLVSLVFGILGSAFLILVFFFRSRTFPVFLAILCFSALLVCARMMALQESFVSLPLDAKIGAKATLVGVVAADPDVRDTSTILTVRVEKVGDTAASAKVRVSVNRFSEFTYGDRVHVDGIPTIPKSFLTDSGAPFDYRDYLLASGVTYEIKSPRVSVLSHGNGNRVVAALLSLKHILSDQINVILPEPKSALLGGLLLGEKQSLGTAITTAFRNAGVVHMIVLSGYNVSLIAKALEKVLQVFLPRMLSLTAGILGIIAFAIMTGASETTIRASIMAILVIIATALRRPADALRLLVVAASVMLVLNPYLLLYDLSFQLSCLATFGLILFADPIANHLQFIPKQFGFREAAASTISAEIVVLPLLVATVGQVSIVSVATNLLVLFAVPWAMLFGFIATVISFVSVIAAFPLTAIVYGLLAYILSIAIFLGTLPFASVFIPPAFSGYILSVIALLYVVAGYFIFRFRQKIFLTHSFKNKTLG